MLSLQQRLLAAEDDFLSALTGGVGAISTFNSRWEHLIDEVDAVLDSTGMDPETCTLVHAVASRIAILSEASAEIFEANDQITSDLVAEIEELVAEISLEDATQSPSVILPSRDHAPLFSIQPSRKRTRSPSEEIAPQPRSKRLRSQEALPTSSALPFLDFNCVVPTIAPNSPPQAVQASMPSHPSKRKRSLSDADSAPTVGAKRLNVGPRLHAVSDSFIHRAPYSQTSPSTTTQSSALSAPAKEKKDYEASDPLPSAADETLVPLSARSPSGKETHINGLSYVPLEPSFHRSDMTELDAFLATLMGPIASPELVASSPPFLSPFSASQPADFLLSEIPESPITPPNLSSSGSSLSTSPSSSRSSSPDLSHSWAMTTTSSHVSLPMTPPLSDPLDFGLGLRDFSHDLETHLLEPVASPLDGPKGNCWQIRGCEDEALLPPFYDDVDLWDNVLASIGLSEVSASNLHSSSDDKPFSWWDDRALTADVVISGLPSTAEAAWTS